MDAAPPTPPSERPPEPPSQPPAEATSGDRFWTVDRVGTAGALAFGAVIVGIGVYNYFTRVPTQAPASTVAPKPPGPTFMPNAPHLPDEENLGFVLMDPASIRVVIKNTLNADNQPAPSPDAGIAVSAFYINKYEVTVAQYRDCVSAGGCRPSDPRAIAPGEDDNSPIRYVSWYEAVEYCDWLDQTLKQSNDQRVRSTSFIQSARVSLPLEAEWQLAAGGLPGRQYPWGDTYDSGAANDSAAGRGGVVSVGLMSRGKSAEGGLFDLSGNVAEWTGSSPSTSGNPVESYFAPPTSLRVVRGGSFYDGPSLLASTARVIANARATYESVGFRVVMANRSQPAQAK